MSKDRGVINEQKGKVLKPDVKQEHSTSNPSAELPITALQRKVGNRAVQRLIAQRSGGSEGFELDEQVANRINRERGNGQALDESVQESMGSKMGYDFSQVKVHTSPEANQLNQSLQAQAFTTGHDIFFQEGAYQPGSSGGQELLAHELTHVVQQGVGVVPSSGKMSVNTPGDTFEQEADRTASSLSSASQGVQRQENPEEEDILPKRLQLQPIPEEEEEVQGKRLQRQGNPEEEEILPKRLQLQPIPEEEEETAQAKHCQR